MLMNSCSNSRKFSVAVQMIFMREISSSLMLNLLAFTDNIRKQLVTKRAKSHDTFLIYF